VYACCLEVLGRARRGTEASIAVTDTGDAVAFEVVASIESPPVDREAILDRLRDRVDALGGQLTASSEHAGCLRVTGSLPVLR
jgi:signal transduction histidine kinase